MRRLELYPLAGVVDGYSSSHAYLAAYGSGTVGPARASSG